MSNSFIFQDYKSRQVQTTLIKVIFPFVLSHRLNVNNLISNLKKKRKWIETKDFLITKSSHHFDHIENIVYGNDATCYSCKDRDYLSRIMNTNIAQHFLDFQKENNNNNFLSDDQLLESLKDFPVAFYKFNRDIDKKPEKAYVIAFSSGVFFVVFEYLVNQIILIRDYHKLNVSLKKYFKMLDINSLMKELIGLNSNNGKSSNPSNWDETDDFSTFDSQKEGSNNTTRFHLFYDIQDLKSSVITLGDCEGKRLANYLLDRNCERNADDKDLMFIKTVSLFADNKVYNTLEGVLVHTHKTHSNEHFTDNVVYSKIQMNTFYSYILVLHQYYFLHHLARVIQVIFIEYDKIKSRESKAQILKIGNKLKTISLMLSMLKTKFMFEIVSQFERQQRLYNMFFRTYEIIRYIEEIEHSTAPLEKVVTGTTSEVVDRTFKMLTYVTVTNALVTVLVRIFEGVGNSIASHVMDCYLFITLGVTGLFFILWWIRRKYKINQAIKIVQRQNVTISAKY